MATSRAGVRCLAAGLGKNILAAGLGKNILAAPPSNLLSRVRFAF